MSRHLQAKTGVLRLLVAGFKWNRGFVAYSNIGCRRSCYINGILYYFVIRPLVKLCTLFLETRESGSSFNRQRRSKISLNGQ